MLDRPLKLGVFGLGCVGQGLLDIIQNSATLKAVVKKVCVKHHNKPRQINENLLCYNYDDILQDPEIDIVVELIDDAEEAYIILKRALQAGKSVVSANKKMLAEHFQEIIGLQKQYNRAILYEAAVCAGIPIIRSLEEYYDNDLLDSIEGIVNGSCNYILTQCTKHQLSFSEALKKAQELGYAESDPSLDVNGYDAKYKLQILLAHAFGTVSHSSQILNIGISAIAPVDTAYANEKKLSIKLIASAYKNKQGQLNTYVMPQFVDNSDIISTVSDVYNGVRTKSYFSDAQVFVGKGAGSLPTASAVISDISALAYNYKYAYKKVNLNSELQLDNNFDIRVYLRHQKNDNFPYRNYFKDIEECYENKEHHYLIGNINATILAEVCAQQKNKFTVVAFGKN